MKKQYTKPAMNAVVLQSQGLLALSGTKVGSSKYTDNMNSQRWIENDFDEEEEKNNKGFNW